MNEHPADWFRRGFNGRFRQMNTRVFWVLVRTTVGACLLGTTPKLSKQSYYLPVTVRKEL